MFHLPFIHLLCAVLLLVPSGAMAQDVISASPALPLSAPSAEFSPPSVMLSPPSVAITPPTTTEPTGPLADALRAERDRLQTLVDQGQGDRAVFIAVPPDIWPKIKWLKPGERHAAVPLLRAALGPAGDVPADPLIYDDMLARAVMQIQVDHNLAPDGIIGPQTRAVLAQSNTVRLVRIQKNLDRLAARMPYGDHYILVNIPQATLWAVRDGQVQLTMPVMVGKPTRPTPLFSTDIRGVRFNPTWTVPRTIARQDILPALKKDIAILKEKRLSVHRRDPDDKTRTWIEVNPRTIDWDDINEQDLKYFKFIQPPGDHNALGRVRVIMPNTYDIYMHDTDTPDLFNARARSISSGCVRLSQPQKLAEFILGAEKWTPARLAAIVGTGETQDIMLFNPFPVHHVYETAWLSDSGRLILGEDIYGLDQAR